MRILDPVAEVRAASANVPLSLMTEIKGKRLTFVSNQWRSLAVIWPRLEEKFRQAGTSQITKDIGNWDRPRRADVLDRIAENSDAAIVGLAN